MTWSYEEALAFSSMPSFEFRMSVAQKGSPIIHAQHRFFKKQYQHKYRWVSDPEIVNSIADAIFGRKKKDLSDS